MKTKFYYLKGKNIVETDNVIEWGQEYEKNHIVEQTTIGSILVSTIFLGLNFRFYDESLPPLLFETMIFNNETIIFHERYKTWDQAEAGHQKAIEITLNSTLL